MNPSAVIYLSWQPWLFLLDLYIDLAYLCTNNFIRVTKSFQLCNFERLVSRPLFKYSHFSSSGEIKNIVKGWVSFWKIFIHGQDRHGRRVPSDFFPKSSHELFAHIFVGFVGRLLIWDRFAFTRVQITHSRKCSIYIWAKITLIT